MALLARSSEVVLDNLATDVEGKTASRVRLAAFPSSD